MAPLVVARTVPVEPFAAAGRMVVVTAVCDVWFVIVEDCVIQACPAIQGSVGHRVVTDWGILEVVEIGQRVNHLARGTQLDGTPHTGVVSTTRCHPHRVLRMGGEPCKADKGVVHYLGSDSGAG